MGWETSDRAARLPADWFTHRRPKVLAEARHRCQRIRSDNGMVCGAYANEVDHIEAGDDHSFANLAATCRWHHSHKTATEAAEGRRRAHAARYPELRARPMPGAVTTPTTPDHPEATGSRGPAHSEAG